MNRLAGKTALITGGNSGVGEATAILFAREGANVIITARREKQLEEVAAKIQAEGHSVLVIRSDISNPRDCEALVSKAVEAFGRLDILVNNAGVRDTGLQPVDKVADSEIDRVANINAKGTMYCMRAALKEMLKNKKGAIVNVSSVAGLNGGGGAAYVASKAAILGITKHTAMRCAKSGVRCNALCPSMIKTPMAVTTGETMDADMMEALTAHSDLTLPACSVRRMSPTASFSYPAMKRLRSQDSASCWTMAPVYSRSRRQKTGSSHQSVRPRFADRECIVTLSFLHRGCPDCKHTVWIPRP